MRAVLVSHAHWDREWYRTFQDFRARLVDLVDRVLDLCAADPGYRFLLDGQTVVLEDYLEIRPQREAELRAVCAQGRIALGPWYVQPDSLLPSGEAHVRNLLLGRRVGEAIGAVSREGYTPDSFGHPAQFPQLFAGFGIRSFLYWRGNGSEIDLLPAEYAWQAPDGSRVLACHLGRGYFSAATPPDADLDASSARIAEVAKDLSARTRADAVLLLNGIDHALPESRTEVLARGIASAAGFEVERGLLEDFVDALGDEPAERPVFRGELVGARVAPLLPGVWSTRSWIKLANRTAEAALEGFAEPFAALATHADLLDERPALELAWKELLKNQAHDSICGCSRDEVHEQMRARFDTARELADQTTTRCLERLAGHDVDRKPPWATEFELQIANPTPRTRTDVVRFPLDFHPYVVPDPDPSRSLHPTVLGDQGELRLWVDGVPARLVPAEIGRMKLLPTRPTYDLEFVAHEVPALGFKRVQVTHAPDGVETREEVEPVTPGSPEARIATAEVSVAVNPDGSFDAGFGDRHFPGLGAIESTGDRGDTYDYDGVHAGAEARLEHVAVERHRHPSGIQELRVQRRFGLPSGLDGERRRRQPELVPLELTLTLRVAPGVPRIDLDVCVENRAEDHRLRLLFPVGAAVERFDAASTFDVVERRPGPVPDEGWLQPAPATFPHQGFVRASGLCVVAPGLAEAEVTRGDESAIAFTLLRCVGALSWHDLESRPGPAGPGTLTPGAQCPGPLRARISLLADADATRAREAELGLRAVAAGGAAPMPVGVSLVGLEPNSLLLSALKPAADGEGMILRVLNPSSEACEAHVQLGVPFEDASPVRLDETPVGFEIEREGDALRFAVPARALRSLRIR
jgi:hypothetical protein